MGFKIFCAVMIIILILFFLSVFGPGNSQKKFWVVIRKIREAMDITSYWFFNICGIGTVLVVVVVIIKGLIK